MKTIEQCKKRLVTALVAFVGTSSPAIPIVHGKKSAGLQSIRCARLVQSVIGNAQRQRAPFRRIVASAAAALKVNRSTATSLQKTVEQNWVADEASPNMRHPCTSGTGSRSFSATNELQQQWRRRLTHEEPGGIARPDGARAGVRAGIGEGPGPTQRRLGARRLRLR